MEFLSRASYHRWILFSRRNFSPLLSRSFPRSTPVVAPRTVQPASSLQDTAVITANLYLSVSLSLSLSFPPSSSSVSFSTASEDIDRSDVSWIVEDRRKIGEGKERKDGRNGEMARGNGSMGGGGEGGRTKREGGYGSSRFLLLPSVFFSLRQRKIDRAFKCHRRTGRV